MESPQRPHLPVLLNSVLWAFEGKNLKYFLDGTVGAGGHAREILIKHPEIKGFIAVDQDPHALKIAEQNLKDWNKKVQFQHRNFSDSFDMNPIKFDGILLDLGVSSMQLDTASRGFSFSKEAPLDMRMNPHEKISAFDIVNFYSEKELGRIFREYGEEKRWRLAARKIAEAREKKHIETTTELVEILRPALKKEKNIHPATLVFQALRIAVNRELEVLEHFIEKAIGHLNSSGRLAIISFHSLEDRIVKNTFRYASQDKEETSGIGGIFLDKIPEVKLITRKPITADIEEIVQNPRSRSAKLRVIEKI